ncbi:epimerase [Sphingomonas sp. Root710]|uniref:NAD-dependent epimerase/dehydratase family protein n=1 Tax=Sphingomonas sp. Root710 TaxID=1736594 RepID=UPI000700ABC7|nr:NAD(P)-dependent oxidoreductase [Sphingomonas sp. Root710]KRB78873.1 epimerase [Sphingomonas sp. Root710]
MTILVTGGTGLVGSRLLKRFAAAEIDCRALVRAGKELPAGAVPVEGDLLDPASLKSAVEGVTAIVHLAAVLRTPEPQDIWTANLDGTRNLIEAAKQYAPSCRFIMASTGLIYNRDTPYPGREDNVAEPQLAYPASKLAAENALRESGLNWSILRLGFVYGEEDGHLEALPKLAGMFKWHPATRMSLIHHRDIETAVNLALDGKMDNHIVNIVDEAPTSILEVATIVGFTMEPSGEPLDNPWFGHLDGSLARTLGFLPKVATVHQAAREGTL